MDISSNGLDLIKRFEGFAPRVYICPAGYPTIGYGHLVSGDDYKGETIDEAEATRLLAGDVGHAASAVRHLIKNPERLTQGQFDALVSFAFNLGAGALQASTLRLKVNRGELVSAADEFGRWVWGGRPPRKLKGLVLRRAAEAAMFRGSTIVIQPAVKTAA